MFFEKPWHFIPRQVVKYIVYQYWTEVVNGNCKKKDLLNRVYECAWRRKGEETLTTKAYKIEPMVHSEGDALQEVEETTVLQETITATAANRASASSSCGADRGQHGAPEEYWTAQLVLNPLEVFDSPEHRNATAHMDRWAEEGMAREMLNGLEWATYCPHDRMADMKAIFKWGMKYVDDFDHAVVHSWTMAGMPTHMRPWLAELEWTWKLLQSRGWLPLDCIYPHDWYIRARALGADGELDPGNLEYDVFVHLLRMWTAVDVNHASKVTRIATSEYGAANNKSSAGPVNLRGNIVEAMLRWMQTSAAVPANTPLNQLWSCQDWYLWEDPPERSQASSSSGGNRHW